MKLFNPKSMNKILLQYSSELPFPLKLIDSKVSSSDKSASQTSCMNIEGAQGVDKKILWPGREFRHNYCKGLSPFQNMSMLKC